MKDLKLNFTERTGLANFLANSSAPLGRFTALQHIYRMVALTEEEDRGLTKSDLGDGRIRLEAPALDYAAIEIRIEDADAEVLRQELMSPDRRFSVLEEWPLKVKAQLEGR